MVFAAIVSAVSASNSELLPVFRAPRKGKGRSTLKKKHARGDIYIYPNMYTWTSRLLGQIGLVGQFGKKKSLQLYNKPAAQAAGQTLPDATPSVGKIHPFSKIAVTFEPMQLF